MSQESYKAAARRMSESSFFWNEVFRGRGIDLGCGNAPIGPEHYPKITKCVQWDKCLDPAHDVTALPFDDEEFDWVHASHVLEHVEKPVAACIEWCRVLKTGGWLVISVPDFYMYEREQWPSRFNPDHKTTFTMEDAGALIGILHDHVNIRESSVKYIDAGFNPDLPKTIDQTRPPYNVECSIEILIRKGES